jgi:hypothetical protein
VASIQLDQVGVELGQLGVERIQVVERDVKGTESGEGAYGRGQLGRGTLGEDGHELA